MGRVGDGGGLRLEREKEKGKETSRVTTRKKVIPKILRKSHQAHAHAQTG